MIRRLGRDRAGSVTIIVAGAMALGLAIAAFAVDLGEVYLDGRRLQGVADAAALAAAGDPARAATRAQATVAASGWPAARLAGVETGRQSRDPALAPDARFLPTSQAPDAARAAATAAVPLHFAAMFGRRSITLTRRATAARSATAAFSIGSRLAAINGGTANALTGALIGGTVSLSVADYRALADARLDMFAMADGLRTRLALTGARYDRVLAANTTLPVLLDVAAGTLDAGGQTVAGMAARRLGQAAAARAMTLGRLFDAGPLAGRTSAGTAQAAASAWDFAQAAMVVSGGRRQVALTLGATIPGLAATKLWFATGERPAQSPWMAIAADGTLMVRTAQTRIHLTADVAVSGLAGIAVLHVPLTVELAEASARLSALSCAATPGGGVTLAVTPSVGHAAIAAVDPARLDDFTTPLTEGTATLAAAGAITIRANMRLALGGAAAQSVAFTRADIAAMTTRTVSTNDLAAGLTASLLARPGLTITVGPVGLGLSAVTGIVRGALTAAAPALDLAIGTATGLAGLHVGQADVTVGGLRCGHAVLVG